MKRIISLVLMVATLFSISAFAEEEFALHSGVCMGMSKEQAIEAEEKNGFTPIIEDNDTIRVEGTIASIRNSSITYIFEDDKLVGASYRLPDYLSEKNPLQSMYLLKKDMMEAWIRVSDALTDKYGVPECGTVAGKYYDLGATSATFRAGHNIVRGGYFTKTDEICEQWLIVLDDGTSVFIENTIQINTYDEKYNGVVHFEPWLVYRHCDAELTEELLNQMGKGQNISDDL
jgi:hypothetical protein